MYCYLPFGRIHNNLNRIRLKIFLSFTSIIHSNFLTSAFVSLKWAISYPSVVRLSEVLFGSAKNVSLSFEIFSLHPKEMSMHRKIFQGFFIFGEINRLFFPKKNSSKHFSLWTVRFYKNKVFLLSFMVEFKLYSYEISKVLILKLKLNYQIFHQKWLEK